MVYTPGIVFTPGEVLTAEKLSQLAGNVEYLHERVPTEFFEATRTTALSVPVSSAGDGTAVTWSQTGASGITLAAGSILTLPVAGRYSIMCVIGWAGRSGGDRLVRVRVGGGSSFSLLANDSPATSTATSTVIAAERTFEAGTTLEVYARQNSASALDITPEYTYLTVARRA